MPSFKNSNYKVLEIDEFDGTVQLENLDMAYQAKARGFGAARNIVETEVFGFAGVPAVGTAVWCLPDQELYEGEVLEGTFEFDPRLSMEKGRVPNFAVKEITQFSEERVIG